MAQGSQLRLGGAGGYPGRPHLPSDILTCSFFKSQQFHLSLTWSWGDSPLTLPRSLMGLPSPLPRHTECTPTGASWLQAGCSESCKRGRSRLNHLGPQEEPAGPVPVGWGVWSCPSCQERLQLVPRCSGLGSRPDTWGALDVAPVSKNRPPPTSPSPFLFSVV